MGKQALGKLCIKGLFLLIAVGLLVFGGICIVAAVGFGRTLAELEKPLLRVPVDLSQANEYTWPLPPVEPYFHGLCLRVELATDETNTDVLKQLFEGISVKTFITDSDHRQISESSFGDSFIFAYRPARNRKAVVRFGDKFSEFASQESTLHMIVKKEAPKLARIDQTLNVHYDLCGLEQTLHVFGWILGAGAVLVGLAIGVPVGLSFYRQIRQPPNAAGRAGGGEGHAHPVLT